jgi:GNAT superfamily N-acetyltransferase
MALSPQFKRVLLNLARPKQFPESSNQHGYELTVPTKGHIDTALWRTHSDEMRGVARLHENSAYDTAEYAVLVRSDLKGKGLGWLLMQTIIEYARNEGLGKIEGQVLNENRTMLRMCAELGFTITSDPNEPDVSLVKLSVDRSAASS